MSFHTEHESHCNQRIRWDRELFRGAERCAAAGRGRGVTFGFEPVHSIRSITKSGRADLAKIFRSCLVTMRLASSKKLEAELTGCELAMKSGPTSAAHPVMVRTRIRSAPHEFVTVRPRLLSVEEAASVPVAGLTANQSIRLKARPTPNDSVFIAGGSGGLGSAAIQILQMIGVEKIVTTSGREASTQFIVEQLRLSPEQVIDYRGKGLKQLRRVDRSE